MFTMTHAYEEEAGTGEGGDAGGAAPADTGDWTSGWDEDVANFVKAKNYQDPQTVARSYMHLQKLHDGSPNVVALPTEEAGEEAWNEFYSKLGRPGDPTAYDPGLPEDAQVDDKLVDWFRNVAFETGLPNDKFQTVVNKWNEFMSERSQEMQDAQAQSIQQSEAEVQALKKEWGKDADGYIAAGQQLVRGAGLDEKTLSQIEASIGSAPMVKLMGILGKRMGEPEFVRNVRENGFGGQNTAQMASAELQRLQGDAEFAKSLYDTGHPGHKANIERGRRLSAQASGGN